VALMMVAWACRDATRRTSVQGPGRVRVLPAGRDARAQSHRCAIGTPCAARVPMPYGISERETHRRSCDTGVL